MCVMEDYRGTKHNSLHIIKIHGYPKNVSKANGQNSKVIPITSAAKFLGKQNHN